MLVDASNRAIACSARGFTDPTRARLPCDDSVALAAKSCDVQPPVGVLSPAQAVAIPRWMIRRPRNRRACAFSRTRLSRVIMGHKLWGFD